MDAALLERLEAYYDAAPRRRSRIEEIGPFTLFVAESGWPYYARPRFRGAAEWSPDVNDVHKVLTRQRELDVPLAFEWVNETTPWLLDVVRSVGAHVEECPLLVLDAAPRGSAGGARMLHADEYDAISAAQAAVSVSFRHGGTARSQPGLHERDEQIRRSSSPAADNALKERLVAGEMRMAAAFAEESPDSGPVGGGSYIPVGAVAEIVGVGVLPAYRRRGLAGHLTYVLATDASRHGVSTVFCSAQSADVARVYETGGFRRVGTACIASVAAT